MWNSLKDILPKVADKYRMHRTLDAIDVCREYRRIAPGMLPKDALANTFAKSYKDLTLTIAVGNPGWAQEVHMRRHLLKDEINRKYGPDTVKNIRIMITDEPISEQGRETDHGPDPGPARPASAEPPEPHAELSS